MRIFLFLSFFFLVFSSMAAHGILCQGIIYIHVGGRLHWQLTGVPYCFSWTLETRLWAYDTGGLNLLTGIPELEEVCNVMGTVRDYSWWWRKSKVFIGQHCHVLRVWMLCPASLIPNHFLSPVF